MGIPRLRIRRSRDRLIFNIGILVLITRHLYIETAPWCWGWNIPRELGQFPSCWSPDSFCGQFIITQHHQQPWHWLIMWDQWLVPSQWGEMAENTHISLCFLKIWACKGLALKVMFYLLRSCTPFLTLGLFGRRVIVVTCVCPSVRPSVCLFPSSLLTQ